MSRPTICAHRGASIGLPDNSVAAFLEAIASGADAIETDVRAAGPGDLVLAHDAIGPRQAGLVRLETLLDLAKGRIGLDLEIKEPRVVPALLDAVAGWSGWLMLSSFFAAALTEVRRLSPRITTGLLVESAHEDPLTAATKCGADVLVIEDSMLQPELLGRADRPVWVWTVNDRERLRELLGGNAVAGVISDDPALAVAVRADDQQQGSEP